MRQGNQRSSSVPIFPSPAPQPMGLAVTGKAIADKGTEPLTVNGQMMSPRLSQCLLACSADRNHSEINRNRNVQFTWLTFCFQHHIPVVPGNDGACLFQQGHFPRSQLSYDCWLFSCQNPWAFQPWPFPLFRSWIASLLLLQVLGLFRRCNDCRINKGVAKC